MNKFAKRLIIGTIVFSLMATSSPMTVTAKTVDPTAQTSSITSFLDTKGTWAESVIQKAAEKGYMKGMPDGKFYPAKEISRAEFVTVLTRIVGNGEKTTINFSDVPANNWAYENIQTGVALGIIDPSDYNGKFDPTKALTRSEMVEMIGKALEVSNPEYKTIFETLKNSSTTLIPIPEFYKSNLDKELLAYIGLAMGTDIITGYTDGTFKPNGLTARSEVAAIIDRLTNAVENNLLNLKG